MWYLIKNLREVVGEKLGIEELVASRNVGILPPTPEYVLNVILISLLSIG